MAKKLKDVIKKLDTHIDKLDDVFRIVFGIMALFFITGLILLQFESTEVYCGFFFLIAFLLFFPYFVYKFGYRNMVVTKLNHHIRKKTK